jgi:hypothetical protein
MALLIDIGDAQLAPVADGGAHLRHVDLGRTASPRDT